MLDPNGFVSTCNSTNFFIIRSNEVWTSSGQYCLHGITRSTLIDLCKNNGIAIFEKNLNLVFDDYEYTDFQWGKSDCWCFVADCLANLM